MEKRMQNLNVRISGVEWEGKKENDYRERYTIESTGEASEDPDDELSRRTYFQLRLRPRGSCTLVSNSFLLGYRLVARMSLSSFFLSPESINMTPLLSPTGKNAYSRIGNYVLLLYRCWRCKIICLKKNLIMIPRYPNDYWQQWIFIDPPLIYWPPPSH